MSPQVSENLLLEIYVETDDLLQSFHEWSRRKAHGRFVFPRRQPKISPSETATILVAYHLSGYKCSQVLLPGVHSEDLPGLFSLGTLLRALCLLYPAGTATAAFGAHVQMQPKCAHRV